MGCALGASGRWVVNHGTFTLLPMFKGFLLFENNTGQRVYAYPDIFYFLYFV
jgi:hypothetical protein